MIPFPRLQHWSGNPPHQTRIHLTPSINGSVVAPVFQTGAQTRRGEFIRRLIFGMMWVINISHDDGCRNLTSGVMEIAPSPH